MKLEIYSQDGKLIETIEVDENQPIILRDGPEKEEN